MVCLGKFSNRRQRLNLGSPWYRDGVFRLGGSRLLRCILQRCAERLSRGVKFAVCRKNKSLCVVACTSEILHADPIQETLPVDLHQHHDYLHVLLTLIFFNTI